MDTFTPVSAATFDCDSEDEFAAWVAALLRVASALTAAGTEAVKPAERAGVLEELSSSFSVLTATGTVGTASCRARFLVTDPGTEASAPSLAPPISPPPLPLTPLSLRADSSPLDFPAATGSRARLRSLLLHVVQYSSDLEQFQHTR